MFEASFQTAMSSRLGMRHGVAQGGLFSPVLQFVRQRHALTLARRRVGPVCGRHVHHSHVLQADAAHQLPGVITQRSSTVVE